MNFLLSKNDTKLQQRSVPGAVVGRTGKYKVFKKNFESGNQASSELKNVIDLKPRAVLLYFFIFDCSFSLTRHFSWSQVV